MTPEAVFVQVAARPGAVWLDGGPRGWSIIACDPTYVHTDGADWPAKGRAQTTPRPRTTAPFVSGVIGYLGYGAGHRVAPVPATAPTPEPEIWLGRYEGALCFHHPTQTWHVTGNADPRYLQDVPCLPEPSAPGPAERVPGWSKEQWNPAVARILELLHAGDCYQINLTRVVEARTADAPLDIYRRLRRSPASWGAYLRVSSEVAILSNSPEQFLIAQGDQLFADPIKGTRRRDADPVTDQAARTALSASTKDLAELTMIVDLVRNDLGRVAKVGSVHVGKRRLTGHANVWHTSQAVTATLNSGHDVWDALAATFPPGSVTGAPKVRACQRIAELEPGPRGVYCGSIGYASDCGSSAWNVAIRTAVWHAGTIRYHVGGGIVVASEAEAEWQETLDKASELDRAIGLD